MAQHSMYCPRWLRLLAQHYLPWCRRELVPVGVLRELRAFVRQCGLANSELTIYQPSSLSGDTITVMRCGRRYYVSHMAMSFDGSGIALVTEYLVRSGRSPVVRAMYGSCDGARDTTGRKGANRAIWRFPPALVYADEDELRELLDRLRTWQREDAQ